MADNAAFKVNEQFLLQQAENKRDMLLSNVTPEQAHTHFKGSATAREVDMLDSDQFKELGYVKQGNKWVHKK